MRGGLNHLLVFPVLKWNVGYDRGRGPRILRDMPGPAGKNVLEDVGFQGLRESFSRFVCQIQEPPERIVLWEGFLCSSKRGIINGGRTAHDKLQKGFVTYLGKLDV